MKPRSDVLYDLVSQESGSDVVCAFFGRFVDWVDMVRPIGKAPKQQSMEPILATSRRLLLPRHRGGRPSGRIWGRFQCSRRSCGLLKLPDKGIDTFADLTDNGLFRLCLSLGGSALRVAAIAAKRRVAEQRAPPRGEGFAPEFRPPAPDKRLGKIVSFLRVSG